MVLVLAFQTATWAQVGKGRSGGRKATVELIAANKAVVPGESLELGLEFTAKPHWHIYWQNSGDSGMPPKVKWELPDGFKAGALQFPVPVRSEAAGGMIVTNILEGNPVLIADVTTPESVGADKVRIGAHVKYLICNESCIREEAQVSLDLPVGASGAAPDHAAVFAAARAKLPRRASRFVTVSSSVKGGLPKPGDKFSFDVKLEVADGYRIVANKAGGDSLTGVDVFVKRVPDVYWDKAKYPEPTGGAVPQHGDIREYDGTVTVHVPGEVDSEATALAGFGGVVVFQPCHADGDCLPPEAVEFSMAAPGAKEKVGAATPQAGGKPETVANTQPTENTPPAASTRPEGSAESQGAKDTSAAATLAEPEAQEGTGLGARLERYFRHLGLVGMLIGCFVYGLFINLTPCVLPLLSIKVLGFVQQAHESRRRTLVLGLSFGAGVMVFFVILGLLAAQGTNILQSPIPVIVLGAVVLAMSLSMLGVYTLQVPQAATSLDAKIQREGPIASFGKGALAPVLGFACTGPLLAGAFGWATQQPSQVAIFAFLVMGLGMASPYMLLGANPNWLSFLPKPGNWMITFERLMGFLLLAMVIWLLHPLIYHIGSQGLEWTLGFFVFVGMACWVWGKIDFNMSAAKQWRLRGLAAVIVLVSGGLVYGVVYPIGPAMERVAAARSNGGHGATDWSEGIPWRTWSREAVEQTVRSGKPVFVDFTSAYCTQCKVNKAIATYTDDVRAKLKALGFVPFQADFTSGDKSIFAEMERFGRAGPPMNLIYKAGDPERPILLRPALTKDYLIEKLEEVVRS